MNIRLIIDTSSEYSLIGVAQNEKIVASQIALHSNQLSQTLFPSLQGVLKEANISLSDLNEIAVGVGPGSYTGTRVGVAIAKALSFGLKTPTLRGFCSLLALLPPYQGTFAAVIPSKTGDFYVLQGSRSEGTLTLNRSGLFDKGTTLEAITGINMLVGKPLKDLEVQIPGDWLLPTPTLEPILLYLQTFSEILPTDLIYLHTP